MTTSVALCTYNGQKYVSQQLDSILSQSHTVDEIVICDDGSTDRTVEIIKEYVKIYSPIIKFFINNHKLGLIKNFEKAINTCTKDIIFLADQDDIWHNTKVEKTLLFFKNNNDKEAVFHDLRIMLKGRILNQTMWDMFFFHKEFRIPEKLSWYLLYYNNVVTGAALAIRHPKEKVHIPISGMVEKYTKIPFFLHDYLLALDYSSKNKLGILDECLIDYRLHRNQNSGLKLARPINFSPHSYYSSTNLSIKYWYINKRLNKIQHYTDLHPDIERALTNLKKEKIEIRKKMNFFEKIIYRILYTSDNIYQTFKWL
ncbi:glycosyltransferase [Spirosoma daeguense]